MIKMLLNNWLKPETKEQQEVTLAQATALLLYEAATADYTLDNRESKILLNALEAGLAISAEEAQALFDWAKAHSVESTSLHPFTQLLNTHLSPEEKTHLMTQLWLVAYADGAIDKYEEHYLRHIADLLYLPHSLYIKAKLTAKG